MEVKTLVCQIEFVFFIPYCIVFENFRVIF
jgi:hypothetical protein